MAPFCGNSLLIWHICNNAFKVRDSLCPGGFNNFLSSLFLPFVPHFRRNDIKFENFSVTQNHNNSHCMVRQHGRCLFKLILYCLNRPFKNFNKLNNFCNISRLIQVFFFLIQGYWWDIVTQIHCQRWIPSSRGKGITFRPRGWEETESWAVSSSSRQVSRFLFDLVDNVR